MGRPFNFAAGPSMLPESVLKSVSDAVIDYEGHGYSILEMMHRKPPFEAILLELKSRVKSLLAVPDDFEILFCPGGGKTTLLRDLIRTLSLGSENRAALRVAVVDERGEIAVCAGGEAQMALGTHTDVLTLCPKAQGIGMVLRAMNPQVIAVDEITAAEDIAAMAHAANCGAALLATMHASGLDELRQKPLWPLLRDSGVFSRAVIIEGTGEERRYRVEELLP